ncbi:MAG: hypothetical protein KJ062_11710 [Thermoanaerobaculia bacterium]|nr:hypothetical protein [Thermoanaerobaculia bacterium]
MRRIAATAIVALGAIAVLGAALPAAGQSNVKVVLQEVVDDRISEGLMTGGLVVVLNLEGDGLDAVKSARFRVREAKDDTGRSLLDPKPKAPDFTDRNVNAGRVQVTLASPPREAESVRLSGTAELFVPGRDPASVVKVPGFLARLDKPVTSKGLKSAKVELTVLSREKYFEARQQNRLDEKKIALIRAEGKERGMKEEELDALVEMAKAFDELGEGDLPEYGLYLRIPKASDDRIQELWLETAAGERIETAGSSSRSDESFVLKQVAFREAFPKDAVLVLSLFTDKSIVTVPFDLKEVPLP